MATTVFDENFRRRLLAFQTHHGLDPDGALDAGCWSKLVEVATYAPAEPDGSIEDTYDSTVDDQAPVPSVSARPRVLVSAAEFPTLFAFAELCSTEEGARRFVRDELGIDLDELDAHVAEVNG